MMILSIRDPVNVGDLVRVVKHSRFHRGPDVRGSWGVVAAPGSHGERWIVVVENCRISLHRNHFITLRESELGGDPDSAPASG